MKVRLLRRARIWHNAGETVKVSSAEGAFLLSVGSAAPVKEKKAKAPEKEEAAAEEDGGTDCHTSVRAGSQ